MISPRIIYAAGLAVALACPAMTRAQDGVPKPEELFQRLVKNGDGKLTADEIPEDQRRFFDRSVRVGDKDGDGVLTKEEFIQANRPGDNPAVPLGQAGGPGRPGQGGGDPRERFNMLDRNKDGKLSKDEIQQVPEQFRERMLQMFERAGKNELTLEEFSRFAGGGPPGGGNFQPGEFFTRLDRNNDGKITKDELPADMRERFAPAFERLGKDELTREDFAQVAQRIFGQGGRPPGAPDGQPRPDGQPPFLPAFFRKLDTNGDGRISKEELAKAAEKFAELDENGDGQLDPRELMGPPPAFGGGQPGAPNPAGRPQTGRPNTGTTPEGRPRTRPNAGGDGGPVFARMDRNGDGKISKDEAPERMRESFGKFDKDGDGFLTPEELRAAFEQLGRPNQ